MTAHEYRVIGEIASESSGRGIDLPVAEWRALLSQFLFRPLSNVDVALLMREYNRIQLSFINYTGATH